MKFEEKIQMVIKESRKNQFVGQEKNTIFGKGKIVHDWPAYGGIGHHYVIIFPNKKKIGVFLADGSKSKHKVPNEIKYKYSYLDEIK